MNPANRTPAPGNRLARYRDPIERGFGRFGHWIYRRAGVTIAIVVVAVAGLVTQLPKLEIDTTTEGLFTEDDPVRAGYSAFREQFGRDQAILVAIETDDVFDLEFLRRLRALHEDFEAEVPYLQDVTSLINVRNTRGEDDELVVEDLLEEHPEDEAALAVVRERVRANRLYVDQLISRDEKLTTILVKPQVYTSAGASDDALAGFDAESAVEAVDQAYLSGVEATAVIAAVEAVAARYESEGFRIWIAGVPVMVDKVMRGMLSDMVLFAGLSLGVIAFFLAVVFRRVAAVLLPLLVSGLAMLATMSAMAILRIPLTTMTQITPSFLLAVGVGSAVHILSIFYQAESRGESKEDSIAHALEHSGLAVVMTSLTTAGGMLSFVSADMAPMRDFGIITPIGILAALAFSLLLLPALVAVVPVKVSHGTDPDVPSPTRQALIRCGELATHHAWPMVAVWAVVLAVAIVGASQLRISHDPIAWFPEDDPMRMAMDKLDVDLNGTMFIETVIDTGREGAVKEPGFLARLELFEREMLASVDERIVVGKTISILDVLKETHQALNENRPEFYALPRDRALIAQELLLFENAGADDMEELVDSQFSMARFTMKLPFADGIHYLPFLDEVERRAQRIFGDGVSVTVTGESRMMTHAVSSLIRNLIKTYALAFAIIAPLMMLLLGSFRMGLVSMIPNLAPVVITMGIMGWFGIPLEVFTLMIGSIAFGLAVDDTVHFMHNFRRYFERGRDTSWAVRETLSTTGQALLFTSIVLSSGFFIYMFATMNNLLYFGMLTGITIILAFLADLLLAPALMAILAEHLMVRPPAEAEPIAGAEPA